MCDTSRSRTAIVTLILGGVYNQQQHTEHETSSGEPALMRLEQGHRAGEGWHGPAPELGQGRLVIHPT